MVLDKLKHFSRCAGLKLNKDKTEAIQLGIPFVRILSKFGIKWVLGPVKVIGVWVGPDQNNLFEKNFINKIGKVKTLLNIWKGRNLTIKGKVTVLRNLAMPILLYPFTVLYAKQEHIKLVDDLFFNFVWPNGKHHVKKKVIIQNIEYGGLNMPDFTTMVKAMKLTWINRFAYKNNTFTHLVSKITGIEIIRNYIKSKPLSYTQLEKYPDFYKQIFQYWFDVYQFLH